MTDTTTLQLKDWLNRCLDLVGSLGGSLVKVPDLERDSLPAGYELIGTDVLKYRARAQAAVDELAGMIARMRLVLITHRMTERRVQTIPRARAQAAQLAAQQVSP